MKLIPLVEVRDILIHVDIIMRFHEMSDFEFAGKDEMLQVSVYKIKVRILVASTILQILQWFYNVKYSKSCLSFIVVPILNYLKIQLLIEALGPLPVILSLQTFLQAYLIGEFIIFFKDPRYLYYTFHFLFRYTSTCTLQLERVQKVDEIFITA